MKVLIKIKRSPEQLFLVNLVNKKITEEVKSLISKRNHSQAITVALTKGIFEGELDCERQGLSADLILTEDSASWDATKSSN
ncbi:MAG: hypothetical protein HQ579_05380 [Candidatus Omnitrophica bacterium]|nr:hypothetical protein [Candidatus Omnitrophota bacterium]